MWTEIAWLMTKAYIILIFTATMIRSEQILYDASTYIFRGDRKNGMYGLRGQQWGCRVDTSLWTRFI